MDALRLISGTRWNAVRISSALGPVLANSDCERRDKDTKDTFFLLCSLLFLFFFFSLSFSF